MIGSTKNGHPIMITKRLDKTKNCHLENLPVDMLILIMQSVAESDWRDLMSLFLSSPNLYWFFNQHAYMKRIEVTILHSGFFGEYKRINLAKINRVLMANHYRENLKFPELNAALERCGLARNNKDYYDKNVLVKLKQGMQGQKAQIWRRNVGSNITIFLISVLALSFIFDLSKSIPYLFSKEGLEMSVVPSAIFASILIAIFAQIEDKRIPVLSTPEVDNLEHLKHIVNTVNHRRRKFYRSKTMDMKLFAHRTYTSLEDLENNNILYRLNMSKEILALITDYRGEILNDCDVRGANNNFMSLYYYKALHLSIINNLIICYSSDNSAEEKMEALTQLTISLICPVTKCLMSEPTPLSTGYFVDQSVSLSLTHCPVTGLALAKYEPTSDFLIQKIAKLFPKITQEVTDAIDKIKSFKATIR